MNFKRHSEVFHKVGREKGERNKGMKTHIRETIKMGQHFGRLRLADHLRSGVQDQPGQHDETLSVLKVQKKLAETGGTCL